MLTKREPTGHAWQETRNSHPDDMALRERGFQIYSRPRKGEPVWKRGGKLYRQSEAVELVKCE